MLLLCCILFSVLRSAFREEYIPFETDTSKNFSLDASTTLFNASFTKSSLKRVSYD